MEAFRVMEPGPMTTVQDLGRFGFQQFGVPFSGSLDSHSGRIANLLVGNPEEAAVLEITFMGPKMEVLGDAQVAVTGADIPVLLNDRPQETWSSFPVRRGDTLAIKQARAGLRAYLAVTGGIHVPLIMGSRSTYIGAKLGGLKGRALAKGDLLERGDRQAGEKAAVLPLPYRPALSREIALRALPGPQDDLFQDGLEVFFESEFKVSSKADRMGYRLEGPVVQLKPGAPPSIISEPSLPGAVQIPPDGQPIVLLVEQTVGGYAKIATVISPDLSLVAQARPQDRVRFVRTDLTAAHHLYRKARQRLEEIRELLAR